MAGLINRAQAAQPVDPKIIQRVVMAAHVALNQPDIEQQIVQVVKSSQDPVQGLAQATVFLMKSLYQKSNRTIPVQALGPAGKEVLVVIAKICESMGLLKVTPQLIQQALAAAVKLIGQKPATPAAPAAAPAAQAPAQPAPVGA